MPACTYLRIVLAVALAATSGSAGAVVLFLTSIGFRDGDGIFYSSASPTAGPHLVFNASDGGPGSTATWDWTGGVLTQTGGTLIVRQYATATGLALTDRATGVVNDANTGVTTAFSYQCLEGTLGATTGRNYCADTAFGPDLTNDSSVAYNFGGNAGCAVRTVGDDDIATSAAFRGLYSHGPGTPAAACGDNTGRGVFDMINLVPTYPNTGVLLFANQNGPFNLGCITPGPAAAIDPVNLCGRVHWLHFSVYPEAPVPASLWLLGSGLATLAWLRRRIS